MNTERNWLIRTTQNQILGPVAKAKVIEFLEKGALGLNDEVTSGNGFWFSLKEKDMVEKYLYGDIPQGYNPISESKSVLSKRENPDKTTSLNTAPANKTQVLKPGSEGPTILPKQEDLEYPDITLVQSVSLSGLSGAPANQEEVKVPAADDLEFPDITVVARPQVHATGAHGTQTHVEVKPQPIAVKARPEISESKPLEKMPEGPVVYPKNDDLEFPDLDNMSFSEPSKTPPPEEEDLDFTVPVIEPQTQTKTMVEEKSGKKPGLNTLKNEVDDQGPTLTLMVDSATQQSSKPAVAPKQDKVEPLKLERKPTNQSAQSHQPEKLLHERKVKNSTQKESTKDLPKEALRDRSMPEHLKKRNDNYLLYLLVIIVLIIFALFFYYYTNILNKPLPV